VDTDGLHFMGLSVVEFVVEIGGRGRLNGCLAFMSTLHCLTAVADRSRHRVYAGVQFYIYVNRLDKNIYKSH
jgi:hypothetical protein